MRFHKYEIVSDLMSIGLLRCVSVRAWLLGGLVGGGGGVPLAGVAHLVL